MKKPTPRNLSVIKSENLTPNMQRITLGGNDLADFPSGQESGYIKLIFPQQHSDQPLMRTYTVRAFNPETQQLVVDFVLHGEGEHAGPASHWARHASVGDTLLVGGPGPTKLVDMSADWFLLAGDMTALPAISCNLELMPSHAKGYAVIEVISTADIQTLKAPAGIEIHWVITPELGTNEEALLNKVKSLPWLEGTPSIWAASEFQSMKALRAFCKKEKMVGKSEIYASSYWKLGRSEDQHKIDKRADAEAEES